MGATTTRHNRMQKAFIDAYLGDAQLNGAKAARLAGYAEVGSNGTGARLLAIPRIKAEIERRLAERARTAGQVLARLEQVAFLDARAYLTVNPATGRLTFDWAKAETDGVLHLIEEVQETEFGLKVRYPSSLQALQLLAKYHGLLTERTEVTVKTDEVELRARILAKLAGSVPVN